tara:strand:+ start:1035 stop:2012 length:978 start_codon:yes stop_codon:yes gene_type:complete
MLNLGLIKHLKLTDPSLIIIASLLIGASLGHFTPATGEWLSGYVDFTLLTLVGLIFFGVRFGILFQIAKSLRFFSIALLANFFIVPFIGYGIASIFLSAHPLLLVGLVIYFMSPCTDWFLSFTRLSEGNVALGTALIPINMILQLLFYPIYLQWFTHNSVQVDAVIISTTLLQWFLLPLFIALLIHQLLQRLLKPVWFELILEKADNATLWITALLVLQIFAGNIALTLDHFGVFLWLLMAVCFFFFVNFILAKGLTYIFKLGYPEHALLTMTIASRNAPLMLAVTMAVLPNQPLVYAAIVIGMLVEIPHLTILQRLLLGIRRSF